MRFAKKYVENLKSFHTPNDHMDTAILTGLYVATSFILYLTAVFVHDDETGKTLAHPQSVAAHLAVFAVAAISVAVFFLLVVLLTTVLETKWCAAKLSWFGSFCGMSHSPRMFGQTRRAVRVLRKEQATLANALARFKQASTLLKTVRQFETEPSWTIAKVRTERLTRRVVGEEAAARSFLRSDALFDEACREIGITSHIEHAGAWCYVAVAGAVRRPATLVLLARYQIAGEDPFGMSAQYWYDGIAADEYGFAALLLAPRVVCESAFVENDTDSYPTVHLSDAVDAHGTYKDTVAALWRPDRWSKHHQPERLVQIARRLDSHRKGGAEFKVTA